MVRGQVSWRRKKQRDTRGLGVIRMMNTSGITSQGFPWCWRKVARREGRLAGNDQVDGFLFREAGALQHTKHGECAKFSQAAPLYLFLTSLTRWLPSLLARLRDTHCFRIWFATNTQKRHPTGDDAGHVGLAEQEPRRLLVMRQSVFHEGCDLTGIDPSGSGIGA